MIGPMNGAMDEGDILALDSAPSNSEMTPVPVRNLRISLKQWKMFHAVIDSDGFAGAANSLHVTQSTVSHAIAKLQEQLGIPLLELKGRKARITEEGKILLGRSRDLVRSAMELEELAEQVRQGWGPEVRVTADPGFPADLLMLALRRLSAQPRKVRLSVKEAGLHSARQALHDNVAELAICAQVPFGFAGKELIQIEHVPVAHPNNPLFALKRDITLDDLKTQFQIAVSGASGGDHLAVEGGERLARYPRPWHVSSLDSAIKVLRHGLGYAWLPKYQIQKWLDAGQLRVLPLAGGSSYRSRLYLIPGKSVTDDSAAARFAEALHACSERFF